MMGDFKGIPDPGVSNDWSSTKRRQISLIKSNESRISLIYSYGLVDEASNNTWRHGGHVGGQEQWSVSPLGTKLYFYANSAKS